MSVNMQIAYQGKKGCESWNCRRDPAITGHCVGWHCANCDESTSQYGHYLNGRFTCEPPKRDTP